MELIERKYLELGMNVAICAEIIFGDCGYPDDFCVQTVGDQSAVFGGTNRLLWHPIYGFSPDELYCTDRFVERFNALYGVSGEAP